MGNYVGRQRAESYGIRGRKKRADSALLRDQQRRVHKMPYRVEHAMELEEAPFCVQNKNGWNPDDKSINIYLKTDQLTLHRRPISQSTDCVRGKVGYTSGLHIWEIIWTSNQRGTHAVVGVATMKAKLRKIGYSALVGSCNETWGWDLGRNALRHGNEVVAPACVTRSVHDSENHNKLSYPPLDDQDTSFIVPTKFMCVLDMDAGTLGYIADGQWLGTAFVGLNQIEESSGKSRPLYPIVSCVWGHCEVTMRYINELASCPLSLKELSRRAVRNTFPKLPHPSLPIPPKLALFCRDYGLLTDARNKANYRYKKYYEIEEIESCGVTFDSLELSNQASSLDPESRTFDSDDLL